MNAPNVSWRDRLQEMHPSWMAFADAVVMDAVQEAEDAGDELPPDLLLDRCGWRATSLLAGIAWIDATRVLERIAVQEGGDTTVTAEDRGRIHQTLQHLRDDLSLLDAFERHAHLLPCSFASVVQDCCERARRLLPDYPETRSRVAIEERGAQQRLQTALQTLLAPLAQRIETLAARSQDAGPEELQEIVQERQRLLRELEQVTDELTIEMLLEETPDGKHVRAFRAIETMGRRRASEPADD